MQVHRFEKVWLGAAILLIVGFIATIAYGSVGVGVGMVDDSGGQISAEEVQNGNTDTPFDDPGVVKTGDDKYTVYVVARQFQFVPGSGDNPIQVPAGANVTFRVTSADVVHGFSVVETNINTMVIPGQVSEVSARFNEPGTYGLICHEYCGAAHHTMGGSVEVVPPEEYDMQQENIDQSADDAQAQEEADQ
ncbi:cytochrome c oxidase subunit II [Haloarcula argentinensis]|uniref:Cytochrome c oxidase subunit II n=1 Tax=Haloarcula argentinensis TaxID=43776 RepID=A0A830FP11_HALAR|nr:cytochrome c oxidase subunit II [Haloarcula argentinensis]EMA24292.1 cytochrome c oxidase subunit II [Haloarcula argentinensis DSM 12282]MDS0253594.1 cytochrome c oxidase subunit II [Haloarcula argentinensis]GGM23294.1 cytochrome c oxidase subunit II [Haloarcula argentinensis]